MPSGSRAAGIEAAVHGFIQTFGAPQGSGEGRAVPHDNQASAAQHPEADAGRG